MAKNQGFPSFASDPAYTAAVSEANRAFGEARQNIFGQQNQLLLQLGSPEFARAFYANNWMTAPGKQKVNINMLQSGMGAYLQRGKRRQVTPFEHNQLQAIQANADPATGTSYLAKIGREFGLQQEALNNELNSANLFYSGYRGKKLGELSTETQQQRAETLFGAQQGMNTYASQLLQAQQAKRQALLNAATLAYQRLQSQRILNG